VVTFFRSFGFRELPVPRRAPTNSEREKVASPERSDRYRRLYEAARSFVFRLSRDGFLRELLPAPQNLMGRPLTDWMSAPFFGFVSPADGAKAREMLARVLEGETPAPFVVRFSDPQGELRHVEFTVVPDEEDGRVLGVVGLANGVTQRRLAEDKALQLERLLTTAQQMTHVGSWEWDAATGELTWSEELCRIHGLSTAEAPKTLTGFLERVHPEDRGRVEHEVREALAQERPLAFDGRIVRPDGSLRVLSARGQVVRDGAGGVHGLIGACQDVTERREHEERIETYLEIGENVPIGLNLWELGPGPTPEPVLVEFNRRAKETGARKEMLGRTLRELLPAAYETELPALLVEAALSGHSRILERLTVGERVYSARIFPVRGRRVGVAFDDITERVRSDAERQRAKEEFQQLVESVQAIVWRGEGQDSRLTFVSREAEALLGYPVRRWLEEPHFWAEHLHPEDHEWAMSFHARALEQGRDHAFEFRMIASDGRVLWLRDVVRVMAQEGAARECVGVMFNVTSRREAEEELRRSQQQMSDLSAHVEWAREEERREVAREIHDELGQALTALKMDISLLGTRLRDGGVGIGKEEMIERLRAMSDLTEDTIDQVRRLARELRPGVLDDLGLEAALEWQAQDFEARTGIVCHFTSGLGEVRLPRPLATAFFRTFQESLTNVTRHAQAQSVEAQLRREGHRLTLEISDDGRGISEEAVGAAKSLGLLGMRERARRLGGDFLVAGARGRGTTVTLSVPLPEDLATTETPPGDRP
jgi:PAS domain S-box-containing protein